MSSHENFRMYRNFLVSVNTFYQIIKNVGLGCWNQYVSAKYGMLHW